jgi:hypothetical protein
MQAAHTARTQRGIMAAPALQARLSILRLSFERNPKQEEFVAITLLDRVTAAIVHVEQG